MGKKTHSLEKVVRSLGNQKKVHLRTPPTRRSRKLPELSEHKELDGFLTREKKKPHSKGVRSLGNQKKVHLRTPPKWRSRNFQSVGSPNITRSSMDFSPEKKNSLQQSWLGASETKKRYTSKDSTQAAQQKFLSALRK